MLQVLCGAVGLGASIVLLNWYGAHFTFPRALEAGFLLVGTAAPMMAVEGASALMAAGSGGALHAAHSDAATCGDAPAGADNRAGGAGAAVAAAASTPDFPAALGARLIGLAVTLVVVCFCYWQLEDYHYSFLSGVFGVDRRPPLLNNETGQPKQRPADDVPHMHNFFRLGGWIYRDLCGGSAPLLCLLLLSYMFAAQLVSSRPVQEDGFYVLGSACLRGCGWGGVARPLPAGGGTPEPPSEPVAAAASAAAAAATGMTVARHFAEMAIRCFFGPLLFCAVCDNLPQLQLRADPAIGPGWRGVFRFSDTGGFNFMQFFDYAQNVIFTFDLCFATVGYLSPAAYLSVDQTALGWSAALVCYSPFYSLVHDRFVHYLGNPAWTDWFDAMNGNRNASTHLGFRAWGCTILLLQVAFASCTACFGLRYSNLAYRTVVTSGPYWFMRHPAYVTKIASFAMIHVPFVDVRRLRNAVAAAAATAVEEATPSCDVGGDNADILGWGTAGAYLNAASVRYCCSLALFAGVYVVRARTEERHLLQASGGEYGAYLDALAARWPWG